MRLIINEKPSIYAGLYLVQRADGVLPEVWMDPESWLNPIKIGYGFTKEGLPTEVYELLMRWKSKREEIVRQYKGDWCSKNVFTCFVYQDKYYRLDPEAFDLSQAVIDVYKKGSGWNAGTSKAYGIAQAAFEYAQQDFARDLRRTLGSPYVRSMGDID